MFTGPLKYMAATQRQDMSKEQENKVIIGRWFADFWGNPWNPEIISELAAPDMLLQYSLHNPRRGHADIEAFMTGFREAFPISSSRVRPISLLRASSWWVAGRVEARTPARPSVTSSSAPSRRRLVGRCTSPARPCFVSRMARSQKRSVWTME